MVAGLAKQTTQRADIAVVSRKQRWPFPPRFSAAAPEQRAEADRGLTAPGTGDRVLPRSLAFRREMGTEALPASPVPSTRFGGASRAGRAIPKYQLKNQPSPFGHTFH